MKVIISVLGRFHGFNLAQELEKRDSLQNLITSYPKYFAKRFDIPTNKVISFIDLEILARAYRKIRNDHINVAHWFNEQFDRRVSKKLKEADIFVGWSGSSIHSIRKAKELGMKTIVERGSSHILYQEEVLKEETSLFKGTAVTMNQKVIEKELLEYEEADFISIPSDYVKNTFIEKGISSQKLIKVPYGVSMDEFFPLKKEDNKFRFIHCGGINLRKGIQYLLKAFNELNLKDAELWMVGGIDPAVEGIIKKFNNKNIIYHGSKPQSELKWFYSQCNVFCLASIEEGLAMVQAQAMACGLPLVTSENSGGADLIEEGIHGFTFKIRDIDTLKERMQYMYDNEDKTKIMGNHAKVRVNESFSWNNYGSKIHDAYKHILETK